MEDFIAYQITTIFKQERTYFIPYLSYGHGLKRESKGKLLDCLNNLRREFRKSGIIISSRRSSATSSRSNSPTLLPELLQDQDVNITAVEDSSNWLHNSSDPWELVEKHCSLTAYYRLKVQFSKNGQSIASYISEYPALKKPIGYFLVSIFGIIFIK